MDFSGLIILIILIANFKIMSWTYYRPSPIRVQCCPFCAKLFIALLLDGRMATRLSSASRFPSPMCLQAGSYLQNFDMRSSLCTQSNKLVIKAPCWPMKQQFSFNIDASSSTFYRKKVWPSLVECASICLITISIAIRGSFYLFTTCGYSCSGH